MKSLKLKVGAVLISIVCLIPLISCNNNNKVKNKAKEDKKIEQSREIKLPYSQDDSLNPYMAKSLINKNLMPLIYDSLYVLDNSYKPKPSVAISGTFSDNTITVRIDSSKCFADGTTITSKDVINSFNLAKASPLYASSLINIESAKLVSYNEVKFTMVKKNKYALSNLSFPIVKSTVRLQITDSFPISSGKYKVEQENNLRFLEINSSYKGKFPKLKKIKLVNITDSNAIGYSLAIGNIDSMFCDLSSGTYQRINAGTRKVLINNLVFLGINEKCKRLQNVKLRQALFTILDREKIVNEGLQGYATPTYTIFNPKWYEIESIKQPGKESEKINALKYIQENTRNLRVRLVVNSENEFKVATAKLIATLLGDAGIKVTVQELKWDKYISTVNGGWYDLYLGEMKLNNDMNIYNLLKPKTSIFESYKKLQDGSMKVQEFANTYYAQLPLIPLCYRNGVLAFSRDIAVEVKSEDNNIYKNIGDWYLKE